MRWSILALLIAFPVWADPPIKALPLAEPTLLGPALQAVIEPPRSDGPPVVAPGRFAAFTAQFAEAPSYVAPNDAFRLYRQKPGEKFVGVKWDAPAAAEPDVYTFAEAKGVIYIVLARSKPGTYSVDLLKNGAGEGPPEPNGKPFVFVIPGTKPDPKPDVKPDPKPAPIAGDGLRVLMLYDANVPLDSGTYSVYYGDKVSSYLNRKCPKGPDGKTPEYRIWASSVNATAESKTWRDALARPRDSSVWWIVSNGRTGTEGVPPSDPEKALEILRQYGGD